MDLSKVPIAQSTDAGAVVADPFMGSASSGEAALRLERSFWGCDIAEAAIAVARARLLATGVPERLEELDAAPAHVGSQVDLFVRGAGAR